MPCHSLNQCHQCCLHNVFLTNSHATFLCLAFRYLTIVSKKHYGSDMALALLGFLSDNILNKRNSMPYFTRVIKMDNV